MFGSQATGQATDATDATSESSGLQVQVAHAIPGRVRLRVKGLKESEPLAKRITQRLGHCDSLQSYQVNPRSDSVVLSFDPADESRLVESLRGIFPQLGELSPGHRTTTRCSGDDRAGPREVRDQITTRLRQLNQKVEDATGGIDLALLVPLALLLLSVLGMVAGAIRNKKFPVPAWYDLLWFAFNTFVILNLTLAQRKEFEAKEKAYSARESPENVFEKGV